MSTYFNKTVLNDNVTLLEIYDKKFVNNTVEIKFISPINRCWRTVKSLVAALLSTSNKNCPKRIDFEKKQLALYDSAIDYDFYTTGNNQIVKLSAKFLSQKFALDGDIIGEQVVRMLLDCIYNPDFSGEAFDHENIASKKQALIDEINNRENDKTVCAVKRCREIAFEGEPCQYDCLGNVSDVEEITQKQIFIAYKFLISQCKVEIVLSGGDDFTKIKKMVCNEVLSHKICGAEDIVYKAYSPLKPKPVELTEYSDVNQAKLVMAFKSQEDDLYAHKLTNALFGGSVTSKLFVNVREKMGLCYSCSSAIIEHKNVMLAACGTNKPDEAKAEILKQLEALKNGDFSNQDIECVVSMLCSGFMSNYDSLYAIKEWYCTQYARGDSFKPEDFYKIFGNIDKDRIVRSAKSFELDTVYVLDKQENKDGQNGGKN